MSIMGVTKLSIIKRNSMRIKTLLNDCQKFKSFVYEKEYTEAINGETALVVEIKARKNSRPICSCCEQTGSQYNQVAQIRDDQFYFRYRRRRVKGIQYITLVYQLNNNNKRLLYIW